MLYLMHAIDHPSETEAEYPAIRKPLIEAVSLDDI